MGGGGGKALLKKFEKLHGTRYAAQEKLRGMRALYNHFSDMSTTS